MAKTGMFLGIPYDWRKPTKERFLSRMWNPDAGLVTDRWYGWGYGFNFYVIIHPVKSRQNRAGKQD